MKTKKWLIISSLILLFILYLYLGYLDQLEENKVVENDVILDSIEIKEAIEKQLYPVDYYYKGPKLKEN
jgi:CRISPR/Cas system endoribonuclease Cas6 (RAMP superfamily)